MEKKPDLDKITKEIQFVLDNSDISIKVDENSEEENLGEIIDQLIDSSNDIKEVRESVLDAVQDYLSKKDNFQLDNIQEDGDQKAGKNMGEFFIKIKREINLRLEKEFSTAKKNSAKKDLTKKDKNNLKKNLKNFIIFSIYQVMNPRAIAGESKKINYQNNLIARGTEVANKYEGGEDNAIEKYSEPEVKKFQENAKLIRKNNGFSR